MKRKTTLILAFLMTLSMLAGCGSEAQNSDSTGTSAEKGTTAETTQDTADSGSKNVSIAQSAPFSMGFGQAVMVYENAYYANNSTSRS